MEAVKKTKKKSKIYFGKDTENTIIEYNKTEDIVEIEYTMTKYLVRLINLPKTY